RVPVGLHADTIDVVNLEKRTPLWTSVVCALGLTVAAAIAQPGSVWPRRSRTLLAAVVLLGVTGLATAFSSNRTLSFYGLYHRYGGLISLAIYVTVAGLIAVLSAGPHPQLPEHSGATLAWAGRVCHL